MGDSIFFQIILYSSKLGIRQYITTPVGQLGTPPTSWPKVGHFWIFKFPRLCPIIVVAGDPPPTLNFVQYNYTIKERLGNVAWACGAAGPDIRQTHKCVRYYT